MNSGATASVLCRRARLYSPLSQDHRSNPFQVSLRIQIPILVGTKIFLMNERVSVFSGKTFFPFAMSIFQDRILNPFQVSLHNQIPILVGTKRFLMNELK